MSGFRSAGLLPGVLAAAACLLGIHPPVIALTDEDLYRQYHLHFIPSSARALGMGGAYVSLAEDATAAATNPAGLRFAETPSLLIENGHLDDDTTRTRSRNGSLEVNPVTGERELPYLSLDSAEEDDEALVPSFVGFAWPLALGRGRLPLVVSASRQVVHSQDFSLPTGGGSTAARFSFESFPNTVSGNQVEAYSVDAPVTGDIRSEIVYWSAAAAVELHPDFSVGATVSYATLDLDSRTRTRVEDPLQLLVNSSHPRLQSQPNTDVYETAADGTDADVAYAVGLLWHPATSFAGGQAPLSLGASFRRGAAFGVEETTTLNGVQDRRFENVVAVPDRYSVGASLRFMRAWLAGVEVERVDYSDAMEEYKEGVNYVTGPHLADGAFTTSGRSIGYRVSDGYVYRAGLERALQIAGTGGPRLALRAGWFLSPDMGVRMTRFNSTDRRVRRTYQEAFPGGDSESHLTAGLGLDWGPGSFQIGIDSADSGRRLLATYAHRFGARK